MYIKVGLVLIWVCDVTVIARYTYAVENAEHFADAGAERPSSGEGAVSLERQTGDEEVVGNGEIKHEAHRRRALDGARERHYCQRVTDGSDNKRDQVEDEYRVT